MLIRRMFAGRAGRIEYLIYLIIGTGTNYLAFYFDAKKNLDDERIMYMFYTYLCILIPFIPIQAVTTRRLRDLKINGGWIIINFIPIVNIPFRIFLCLAKGKSAGST